MAICTFFGHRYAPLTEAEKEKLTASITDLVTNHDVTEFWVGAKGEFDSICNSAVTKLKKEFPNKLIHTFAYQYSRKTPTKVIPSDNVIVRLCNIECSWSRSIEEAKEKDPHSESAKFYEDLLNWSKITKRLYIWDYAVNFRNYLLPFPNLRTIDKNIKLYKKLKVQGVLMQGNFSHGGGGYLDELKSYVTARLLLDDSEELDVLIKEFCDNYYGKNVSNQVIAYINLWEDHVKDFDMWLYDDADHPMFDEVMIDKSLILLKDAYQNADKDKKMRVEKLLLGIEYLRLVRLELDYPNKEEKIEQFRTKLLEHKITEIFERTALDYSIDVMKNSRYAKDRPNWYSLYYIMK